MFLAARRQCFAQSTSRWRKAAISQYMTINTLYYHRRHATSSTAERASASETRDDIKQDYIPAIRRRDIAGNPLPEMSRSQQGLRLPTIFSMKDKVCVVAGGASGSGRILANALLGAGCTKLAILDLDEEAADRTVEAFLNDFGRAGLKIKRYKCDVTNEPWVTTAFERIAEDFGRIDHLTIATGFAYAPPNPAKRHTPRRMQSPFSISVDGAFWCSREAASVMEESKRGGSIVLLGSIEGAGASPQEPFEGNQPQSPYEASLAACRQMARSLALEWAPFNIRVNSITPGPMSCPLTKAIADRNPDLREKWEKLTPAGRLGEPEDLAGPLIYLASDASSYVPGTDLKVDGGWSNL